jgi:hypothetical protein
MGLMREKLTLLDYRRRTEMCIVITVAQLSWTLAGDVQQNTYDGTRGSQPEHGGEMLPDGLENSWGEPAPEEVLEDSGC